MFSAGWNGSSLFDGSAHIFNALRRASVTSGPCAGNRNLIAERRMRGSGAENSRRAGHQADQHVAKRHDVSMNRPGAQKPSTERWPIPVAPWRYRRWSWWARHRLLRGRDDARVVHGRCHRCDGQTVDPRAHRWSPSGEPTAIVAASLAQSGKYRRVTMAWEKQFGVKCHVGVEYSGAVHQASWRRRGWMLRPARAGLSAGRARGTTPARSSRSDRPQRYAKNPLAHLHQPGHAVEKVMESRRCCGPNC